MFLSMTCRFFFVSGIHRIYESYDTSILRATLYSSHELFKREDVFEYGGCFLQSTFIFATAMRVWKIDYEILSRMVVSKGSFAWSKF